MIHTPGTVSHGTSDISRSHLERGAVRDTDRGVRVQSDDLCGTMTALPSEPSSKEWHWHLNQQIRTTRDCNSAHVLSNCVQSFSGEWVLIQNTDEW